MVGRFKQWMNVLFQNKSNTEKCIILMKQIRLGRNYPEFVHIFFLIIDKTFPFFNRYRKKFCLVFSLWGEITITICWHSNSTGHFIYWHMPVFHVPNFSKSRFLICAQSIFSLLTDFLFQISKCTLGRIFPAKNWCSEIDKAQQPLKWACAHVPSFCALLRNNSMSGFREVDWGT